MQASLIFTACNQGDWLRRTIGLARESFGDLDHEIIVIDDQSTDGCCHGLDQDCLIVRTDQRKGVSACRRLGAEKASGDVLIFSDPHCEYPDQALKKLARAAYINQAIFMPPTRSSPNGGTVCYGGQLRNSERGIVVAQAARRAQQMPALINTIYALQPEVYQSFGGWPELPGCWGYSEQAMTLIAWSCCVPIMVLDLQPCIHYAYQEDKRFPFNVQNKDRVMNAHIVHAAFFPEYYEKQWKDMLEEWNPLDGQELLRDRRFRRLRDQIRRHALVTDEKELLRHIRGVTVDEQEVLEQQRARTLKVKRDRTHGRLRRSFDWLMQETDNYPSGRICIDLGARDGMGCEILKEYGAARVIGIELVPEMVNIAREMDRPVRVGDICKLPRLPKWDVVTCIHTLEHVLDPEACLRGIVEIMRPGGWLMLVVPKEDAPSSKDAHNCCFPTRQSLKDLVSSMEGLDPETIKTQVAKFTPDKYEIRLLVQRKRP